MDREKLIHWLILLHAPQLGPATILTLLESGPNLRNICKATPQQLGNWGLQQQSIQAIVKPNMRGIEQDLAWVDAADDHYLVDWDSPHYPPLLRQIASPPLLLFVHGNVDLLSAVQLAMVGSRNPSRQGRENAFNFAHELSAAGITITSGLALGIDAASHQGSLNQIGKTIAVMGTGIDSVYPRRHQSLADNILANDGAIISEFPSASKPLPNNFPRRNRIISGLALGTIVIEAALQSGSLITARLAMEQSREVFALPGSIHNPLARGCHLLIKQGAKLVETISDIVEEIPQIQGKNIKIIKSQDRSNPADLSKDQQILLKNLDDTPTAIDILVERTGFTAEVVSSMLLVLDLQGLVESAPCGYSKRHI